MRSVSITKGSSIELDSEILRARYREDIRKPVPVKPGVAERYDFDRFHFIARRRKELQQWWCCS